jgi:hypothetical protein
MPQPYENTSIPSATLTGPAFASKKALLNALMRVKSSHEAQEIYARMNSTDTSGWSDPTATSKLDIVSEA